MVDIELLHLVSNITRLKTLTECPPAHVLLNGHWRILVIYGLMVCSIEFSLRMATPSQFRVGLEIERSFSILVPPLPKSFRI